MEISNEYEVWRILRKDKHVTRPPLYYPYLDLSDKDDPRLIATDSAALVAVPVDVTKGDKSGYIPAEALKETKRTAGHMPVSLAITKDNRVKNTSMTEWPRPDVGEYVHWRGVFPKPNAETFDVSFDPVKLLELVKSAGGKAQVSLHFAKTKDGDLDRVAPIICRVYGHEEVGLILMPMRDMDTGKSYNPKPVKAKKEPKAKSKAKK